MSQIDLQPGYDFGGRYRIVRRIAAGGMGAVYEVVHLETERRRALKVMLPEALANVEMRERFKREARITATIDSEYIVEVFDAGVDAATQMPFLVMELLRGEELGHLLARQGALPLAQVVTYLSQIALALDKTHAAQNCPPRFEAREHLHHAAGRRSAAGEDPRLRHLQEGRGGGPLARGDPEHRHAALHGGRAVPGPAGVSGVGHLCARDDCVHAARGSSLLVRGGRAGGERVRLRRPSHARHPGARERARSAAREARAPGGSTGGSRRPAPSYPPRDLLERATQRPRFARSWAVRTNRCLCGPLSSRPPRLRIRAHRAPRRSRTPPDRRW